MVVVVVGMLFVVVLLCILPVSDGMIARWREKAELRMTENDPRGEQVQVLVRGPDCFSATTKNPRHQDSQLIYFLASRRDNGAK